MILFVFDKPALYNKPQKQLLKKPSMTPLFSSFKSHTQTQSKDVGQRSWHVEHDVELWEGDEHQPAFHVTAETVLYGSAEHEEGQGHTQAKAGPSWGWKIFSFVTGFFLGRDVR